MLLQEGWLEDKCEITSQIETEPNIIMLDRVILLCLKKTILRIISFQPI